ncbi:MAG: hypothetical protein IJH99_02215 [Eubacterium sp.]|nr:hypothetical protein [Eubacterium sp.]
MVNSEELKGKEFKVYRQFYCGVCQDLRDEYGQPARLALTYDCVFLSVLLTALYEEPVKEQTGPCLVHPFDTKKIRFRNKYTAYAADLCILLTYHNLMDDWLDEKKKRSIAAAAMLKKAYKKTAAKYPRQVKAIRRYIGSLHMVEKENSKDLDRASSLTGHLFEELYDIAGDVWSPDLRQIGFYLGKFIYLMDAYEDVEKDMKTGSYNPFIQMFGEDGFDEKAKEILLMVATGAARAFERLPIVQYADILRNVLYSGIWVKYHEVKEKRGKE